MAGSEDTIDDDELLYRKISVNSAWHDENGVSPQAFKPRDNDVDGISFSRATYTPIEIAAQGPSRGGYFVAVLRAGDLRRRGIQIVPTPTEEDPGHASIPDLNCQNKHSVQAKEWMLVLAEELCLEVKGPYASAC